MDYTSIHIYGHLLSDDILKNIEQDTNYIGNRDIDYGIDSSVTLAIDYAWSSLRNDWQFFKERSSVRDPYGTRRSRELMERLFLNLGYELSRQNTSVTADNKTFDINYLCKDINNFPIIVIGNIVNDEQTAGTVDKCSLDVRVKGGHKKKSAHATMLEYLNSTENVYGIVSNGQTLRLIRNSGQLVKLTYAEFDIQRMIEEDKYTEFCLMFRMLHSSRFRTAGDSPCVMEQWFNMSIESGNRIRDGLSKAVQRTMEVIGNAALTTKGDGNDVLRQALIYGDINENNLNKELIHFIYRLLFLFIIEDRNLVYQLPESAEHEDYKKLCRSQDIYNKFYAASRLRKLSEYRYLYRREYYDLWQGLMDTFRLFENGNFGEELNIKPLGGKLFDTDTLHYIKNCRISNEAVLEAFKALNEFKDESGMLVKINYSALDVEEFGSVYEGILEMRPYVHYSDAVSDWRFGYVEGLDRNSTSSYYTRPDLVQSLIKTTLEPVIKERLAKCNTPEEQVKSLLSMRVCDPASGSGHFVLAMARTIAWYVCTIRTGEDNPASLEYRQALREVIQKCVYAVDYNPDAVELCKVVLWIEGYCAGMPLSFLDHHIRCGNSVVGVTNLDMLLDGVPQDAFAAKDNDKDVLNKIKAVNKEALDNVKFLKDGEDVGLQLSFFTSDFQINRIGSEQISLAEMVKKISAMPEDSLPEEVAKQRKWEELMQSPRVKCLRRACDIYTYAFYKEFTEDDIQLIEDEDGNAQLIPIPYTRTVYQALEEIKYLDVATNYFKPLPNEFKKEVRDIAREQSFFHWCVEFPEIFAYDGGFDVMCGNPPWDEIQIEDEKWFVGKNEEIVAAPNQSARKKMIAQLEFTDNFLYTQFKEASRINDCQKVFIKKSGRFSLTSIGKLELSSLFAELCLSFTKEAWGLVIPTGIAVNDSNKYFFAKLIDENRLISLYDFENREKLFDIHRMFKFCLLTAGSKQEESRNVNGGFYLTRLNHILDPRRIYTLKTSDFARFNPNTKTCPIFRTSKDAELTAKIYRNSTILYNENSKSNPWDISFSSMFNMSTASYMFRTYTQLLNEGGIYKNGEFDLNGIIYVPLYEGKMIWHYNHHYGNWPTVGERPNAIDSTSIAELQNTHSNIVPWYWIPLNELKNRLIKYDKDGNIIWEWKHKWLLSFRDVTNSTNERTFICSPIPDAKGVGHSATLLFAECGTMPGAILLGMMSSISFDYAVRQKLGGSHASITFVKQFPVLRPSQIPSEYETKIITRVAELCYFNHDMDGWAEELWEEMNNEQRTLLPQIGRQEPFIYDPERRAVLQAELDAIFAHLYGLSTEDLRYILDPEDVCGEGCINETFRVLKENEMRKYGEYRTKRLVLEAWDKFGYDN